MPAYPLRALVLRKTKLGETDVIVTMLAEDGHQVRAVAKGLRRPGSKFGARLEPYGTVDLLLHTGRSLEVVAEARTVASRASLREDLDRSAAAAVVADVLDKITAEGQPESRLALLAAATLDVMESAEVERLPATVVAFLVKAMAMHGYRPELEACVICASDASSAGVFSLGHGGPLCPDCGDVDPAALRVPAEARAWLATLMASTMAQVADLDVPAPATADCFGLMRSFIAYHVPTRLKALDFYAGVVATLSA
jgi:DNA repair protein RecO (recombination protein O)